MLHTAKFQTDYYLFFTRSALSQGTTC